MIEGHCCFRCRTYFPSDEGVLCTDSNGNPQIICSGCYMIELIRVTQEKIEEIVLNPSLVSFNTRLDLSITKFMLTEVVNA